MSKHLSEYVASAAELNWGEFSSTYPDRVLVILPPGDTSESGIQTFHGEHEIDCRPEISDDYRVRPLKKRFGSNPFTSFVTLGRAGNNDIVVNDIEVSKVHAYFEEDERGNWLIRDGNSTNGTYVNGIKIPSDSNTLLKSTDTMRFSAGVSAVFFDPADFYQFLRSNEVVEAFQDP